MTFGNSIKVSSTYESCKKRSGLIELIQCLGFQFDPGVIDWDRFTLKVRSGHCASCCRGVHQSTCRSCGSRGLSILIRPLQSHCDVFVGRDLFLQGLQGSTMRCRVLVLHQVRDPPMGVSQWWMDLFTYTATYIYIYIYIYTYIEHNHNIIYMYISWKCFAGMCYYSIIWIPYGNEICKFLRQIKGKLHIMNL